jgi:hypothetical protein
MATVDELTYTLDTPSAGQATLTGTTKVASFALVIPASINTGGSDYDVVAIAASAFLSNTDVTAITINNSVTTCGTQAFESCSNATSVSMSTGLNALPLKFMFNCSGLTSLTIPSNVTTIGNSCWRGCSALSSVTNNATSLSSLGTSTFQGCTSLTAISFTNFGNIISQSMFNGCTTLATITNVPATLTNINSNAFNATAITSFNFSNTVGCVVGTSAFEDCTSLVTFSLFGASDYDADAWPTISLGNGGSDNFLNCTSLTTIKGKFSTGPDSFAGCTALDDITLFYVTAGTTTGWPTTNGNTPTITFYNNNIVDTGWIEVLAVFEAYSPAATIEYRITSGSVSYTSPSKSSVTLNMSLLGTDFSGALTIPSTVTVINNASNATYNIVSLEGDALKDNTALTGTLTFPNTITSCGTRVAQGCSNITGVVLSTGLDVIPISFLFNCTSLASITIPSNVTSLGSNFCRGCTSLAGALELPTALATIGNLAFNGTAITSVSFPADNPFTQELEFGSSCFLNCASLESLYVYNAEGISFVFRGSAFSGCNALTSILFEYPEGLVTVDANVFPTTGYTDPLNVTYYHTVAYANLNALQKGLQTDYFDEATSVSYTYTASCFAKGTLICCYDEERKVEEQVAIEDLRLGQLVKTYPEGYRPVSRFGAAVMTSNPFNSKHVMGCMFTMAKEGNMTHDLTLVGGHSLMVDALTEEEAEMQESLWGFSQRVAGKALLLAAASKKFVKVPGLKRYDYYHFAVDESEERYGAYANGGVLCELPSAASFDTLAAFKAGNKSAGKT